MTFHLKNYPDALRQLFVAASVEETNKVFDQAISIIQKNFSLPGYRKGKVPVDIIIKTNPPELMSAVSELFQQKALETIESPLYGQPRFNPMSGLSRDKEFVFSIVYEIYPEITKTPDLNKEINYQECIIEEKFIEETLCRQIGLTEVVTSAIQDNDLVQVIVTNSDYKGDKKEAAFDVSKLSLLTGKKTGDTLSIAFDQLSGYLPEFLGKVSDPLIVTIAEVSRAKVWKSVTDEEISEKTPFKTKDEYKKSTEEQLANIAKSYNDSQKAIALSETLGSQIDVEIPKSLWLNNLQDLVVRTAEQEVIRKDIALNDLPSQKEILAKFTQMPMESRNGLASVLWLDHVAREENLSVDDQELEFHYYRYAQNRHLSLADFKKKLRPEDKANIRLEIVREKAMEHIISKTKFKAISTISVAEVLQKN